MNPQSLILLGVFFVAMYFMMIRPQRKKDKQIAEMRNSLQVGDEIITIGGICGKIIKTKNDSIIIQVGADKLKFEMMRWSVSSVVSKSHRKVDIDDSDEAPQKKAMPKRLKKSSDVEETEAEAKPEEKAAPKKSRGRRTKAAPDEVADEAAEAKPAEAAEAAGAAEAKPEEAPAEAAAEPAAEEAK